MRHAFKSVDIYRNHFLVLYSHLNNDDNEACAGCMSNFLFPVFYTVCLIMKKVGKSIMFYTLI